NTFNKIAKKWDDLLDIDDQEDACYHSKSDPDAIAETVFTESVGLNELQSVDPFNIYDLLNKGKQQENTKVSDDSISREHPPGFTPKEDDKELDHVDDNISEPKEDLQEDKDVNSTCSKLKSNSLNSGCSVHFKVSNVPKSGGSILNYMEELVKVGQTMGYKIEGCENDILKIIEAQGYDSVHR
nr:RNA-directed DNA polymerase, eukaryota [Tanacetum cinerariifolium]